eukprot:CAMPEP_0184391876 /NCGR_PEP_ID=MMETSP0007-20130409/19328_1 /TAXON_ID=97485 /ORGANISM="Prymnesium parvum, Strain Texoma1" /LENGTH=55 /DNA_ID=CAMNT_0026742233 /DNA_START=534 /DNA_END=698 /DNA_ORIENTATION=-
MVKARERTAERPSAGRRPALQEAGAGGADAEARADGRVGEAGWTVHPVLASSMVQ